MRKVFEIDNGNECARVYRNGEWDEFIVRFYSRVNGQLAHLAGSDYHSPYSRNDRESVAAALADASNTAKQWVN